jgi:hypothetical protein
MDISSLLSAELKKQALSQITKQIGGDNKVAQSLIAKALPSILSGLEKNISTEDGKNAFGTALEKHTGETKIDMADGAKILGHLLGSNKQTEVAKIARESGASEEQSNQAMSMLSSLVMEKLGDQKKSGLDTDTITKMLSGASKNAGLMGGFDQDGDGDFDKNDAVKFGLSYMMKKFLGKK